MEKSSFCMRLSCLFLFVALLTSLFVCLLGCLVVSVFLCLTGSWGFSEQSSICQQLRNLRSSLLINDSIQAIASWPFNGSRESKERFTSLPNEGHSNLKTRKPHSLTGVLLKYLQGLQKTPLLITHALRVCHMQSFLCFLFGVLWCPV